MIKDHADVMGVRFADASDQWCVERRRYVYLLILLRWKDRAKIIQVPMLPFEDISGIIFHLPVSRGVMFNRHGLFAVIIGRLECIAQRDELVVPESIVAFWHMLGNIL